MQAILDDAICPACGARALEYRAERIDLPFLGHSLETMLRCPACGYRHVDFVLLDQKEPTRHTCRIATEQDMSVRVVRSASGTIRIPELGILIEPAAASEAFISNIEGILVRVERVLDMLHRDAESADARERVESLQDTLARMRDGTAPAATLVIEDPFGNSAILGDDVHVERIPDEEAGQLRVGTTVIDPQGLVEGMMEEEE